MISCHDPENFKNPEEYLPERWLMHETKTNSRCSEAGVNLVVPFGVGKRQCPGRRFVEMELILIVAKVSENLIQLHIAKYVIQSDSFSYCKSNNFSFVFFFFIFFSI